MRQLSVKSANHSWIGRAIVLVAALTSVHAANAQNQATQPLIFDRALQEILSRDTAIASQKRRVEAIASTNLPIRLVYLPSLSGTYAEYRSQSRANNAATLDNQRSGLNLSWNIFRFGADLYNNRAASADEARQENLLEREILRSERLGAEKIFNHIRAHEEVEITEKIYDSEKENHRIARMRFQRGLLPQQEVEKVFIDLVNAEARLRNAEIKRAESDAQLSSALGHSQVRLEWPWQVTFLERKLKRLPLALELHEVPAYRGAAAAVEAENFRQKRDLRNVFPRIDLEAEYNFRNTSITPNEWAGSLALNVPLFDRLTNYSAYKARAETRAIADLELEQARRDAAAEFTAARESFATALETAIARAESLKVARRLYRDNELRFKNGRINANDLIVDQDRLFRTELNALEGWYNSHLAYVRVCHALGRRLENCGVELK